MKHFISSLLVLSITEGNVIDRVPLDQVAKILNDSIHAYARIEASVSEQISSSRPSSEDVRNDPSCHQRFFTRSRDLVFLGWFDWIEKNVRPNYWVDVLILKQIMLSVSARTAVSQDRDYFMVSGSEIRVITLI
jgi:hypothetical protein